MSKEMIPAETSGIPQLIPHPSTGYCGKIPKVAFGYIKDSLESNGDLAIAPEDETGRWEIVGYFCDFTNIARGFQTSRSCNVCKRMSKCEAYTKIKDFVSVLNGERNVCPECLETYADGASHACKETE